MNAYRRNLHELFETCSRVLQPETLFIWTTALPVSQSVRGGVILEPIRFLSDVLRYDVLMANHISSCAARECRLDVVDLHYSMRRHIDMRLSDGIHWNAEAHRKITSILLHHVCFAWNVSLPVSVSVGFSQLFTRSEAPAGDDRRSVAASRRAAAESNRVPSKQQQTPRDGLGDGLLPVPVSRPQQALARRGRRFCGPGASINRSLCAPSVFVDHDDNDARHY